MHMKIQSLIVVLLLSLLPSFLISACGKNAEVTDAPSINYICPNGIFAHDAVACIPVLQIVEPVSTDLPPPTIIATPLDTQGGKFIIEEGHLFHNLDRWNMQEIIEGMALYDDIFHLLVFLPVRYQRDLDEEQVYEIGTKKMFDPFYILRSEKGSKAEQAKTLQFRILVYETPQDILDKVEQKHTDSKFKLLYPGLFQEWTSLNCTSFSTCRDIDAVRCTKDDHTLISWSFKKQSYDTVFDKIHYNMQSVDDFGRALDAFMNFYCTPV